MELIPSNFLFLFLYCSRPKPKASYRQECAQLLSLHSPYVKLPGQNPCSQATAPRPAVVLLGTPFLCVRLIGPFVGQEVCRHIVNLDTRRVVQHLQVFKDCLADLVQILSGMRERECMGSGIPRAPTLAACHPHAHGLRTALPLHPNKLFCNLGCLPG